MRRSPILISKNHWSIWLLFSKILTNPKIRDCGLKISKLVIFSTRNCDFLVETDIFVRLLSDDQGRDPRTKTDRFRSNRFGPGPVLKKIAKCRVRPSPTKLRNSGPARTRANEILAVRWLPPGFFRKKRLVTVFRHDHLWLSTSALDYFFPKSKKFPWSFFHVAK